MPSASPFCILTLKLRKLKLKLRNNQGTVETSGLEDSTSFSIKVNGKAFRILLDGLYSDKVAAVIRELSTNAYDGHLAIGKGAIPFEVTLPSQFDPTFKVRDFGVSMTHEQLMRLITTVFESSKDNANNQVGAFGLGSKSPFSMVDTYTITAWKDGEKRIYSAFFNSDGVPSLALLDRSSSTEPQGVEFSMIVNAKDVRAFQQTAPRVLQWFPTIPKIINGPAIGPSIGAPAVSHSGKGWKLVSASVSGTGSAMARQGCVVYPINASALPSDSMTSETLALITQTPLLLDFPIGSLDVAASRESLSYDEETCKNIIARLNSVKADIITSLGKEISDAPTLWEAGARRHNLDRSGLPRVLVQILATTKWKGKFDCSEFRLSSLLAPIHARHAKTAPANVPTAPNQLSGTPTACAAALSTPTSGLVVYAWDRYRVRRSEKAVYLDGQALRDASSFTDMYGNTNTRFVFSLHSERPTHEGRRIRGALNDSSNNTGYYSGNLNAVLFVVEDEAAKDEILKVLGSPPAVNVLGWTKDIELPAIDPAKKAPKQARGTTQKTEIKAYPVQYDASQRHKVKLLPEQILSLSGDAYYVITAAGDGVYTNSKGEEMEASIESVKDMVVDLQNLPNFNKAWPVYLISTVYEKRVTEFGKWTCLFKTIETLTAGYEAVQTKLTKEENLKQLVHDSSWCKALFTNRLVQAMVTRVQQGAVYDLGKVLQAEGFTALPTYTRQSVRFNDSSARLLSSLNSREYYAMRNRIDDTANKDPQYTRVKKAIETCDTAYPLVGRAFEHYSGNGNNSAYVDYIEAIEMLRASRAAASSKTAAKALNPFLIAAE